MKNNLYFVQCDTADNYILLATASGHVYTSCCAPDGDFARVALHISEGETAESKADQIRAEMGDDLQDCIDDLADQMDNGGWMGDCLTDDNGEALTLDSIDFGRDTVVRIG